MKWEKVRLGDIAEFSNGLNFDKSSYAQGIPIIGVSNFGDKFSPDYEELAQVKPEIVREVDYLDTGDIVFVRSNGNKELVGRCMLINNLPTPTTFSGFCIRARILDKEKFDPTFFAYHFKDDGFRKAISGKAIGANIQNLSQARLANYDAMVPDIRVQRRIADILSAYDDLIENNRKQIKLLEEAAQRLYKEWFVELRFPGHETTPIVDGVPKGWRNVTIEEMSSVLRRGISPRYNDEGRYTVINQKCIRQSVVSLEESRKQEKDYLQELNLQDSDTVICSTGAGTLGRVGQIFGDPALTTFDSHVTLVRAKESIGKQYLFLTLKDQQEYLMGAGKGSTNQLELGRGTIQAIKAFIPTDEIMKRFESIAQPIHDRIRIVNDEIEKLVELRERLLPKLMSGEIEV